MNNNEKRQRGRPKKDDALTSTERVKRHRAKQSIDKPVHLKRGKDALGTQVCIFELNRHQMKLIKAHGFNTTRFVINAIETALNNLPIPDGFFND